MNKLGIGCTPLAGDMVTVSLATGNPITGTVLNWGAEAWDQNWITVKSDEGAQVQMNIAHIRSYSILKRAQAEEYKLVRTETKEGEVVKSARAVSTQNAEPKFRIKKGQRLREESGISRTIDTPAKGVEETTVQGIKLEGGPINQAQQLAELYDQKRKMTQQDVSDHMRREDLVEVNENYGLPSFKKRP